MKTLQHRFKAMGSPCELQLDGVSPEQARLGIEISLREIERLEALYSRYRDSSLLSEINRFAARGESFEVDEETASLLDYVEACFVQSDGLFDITSGILRRAWDFKSGRLPGRDSILALLDRVGWRKLRWTRPHLHFDQAGLELDLGGVVKEYAADRVASLCLEAGLRHGMVNLGGDIRVIGPRANGKAWRIGIRDPQNPKQLAATLSMRSGALASSGDYERCITMDGVRYGHVLSPLTGWPVAHLASVSVVADFCLVAGSTATIALLREASGPTWLTEMGLAHFFVDVQGRAGGSLLGA